jgi:hypothetical protein
VLHASLYKLQHWSSAKLDHFLITQESLGFHTLLGSVSKSDTVREIALQHQDGLYKIAWG